ncbi:MAG: DUF4189 domain-containing protein [Alphaproteobacteria bacterium]
MRKSYALALAAVLWAGAGSAAQAASAVAWDNSTGAWAYFAQLPSVAKAEKRALDSCREQGGRECKIIVSCEQGGYGRIYRYQRPGQRRVAIGASCGWYSAGKANEAAEESCNRRLAQGLRCGAVPVWYDAYKDDHVPPRCKNAEPSRDPCYRQ